MLKEKNSEILELKKVKNCPLVKGNFQINKIYYRLFCKNLANSLSSYFNFGRWVG